MAVRMGWVVLDTPDPRGLAPFWEELLGARRGEEADHMVEIPLPAGAGFLLWRSPDPTPGKNRMHVDLVPDDDQDAEVERALRLGATRVDIGQGDARHVVLADPEGNEFCILRPDDA
jgi:predicted enzyme related to lactoylglutathione lyase